MRRKIKTNGKYLCELFSSKLGKLSSYHCHHRWRISNLIFFHWINERQTFSKLKNSKIFKCIWINSKSSIDWWWRELRKRIWRIWRRLKIEDWRSTKIQFTRKNLLCSFLQIQSRSNNRLNFSDIFLHVTLLHSTRYPESTVHRVLSFICWAHAS